jgi:hypothetical protein
MQRNAQADLNECKSILAEEPDVERVIQYLRRMGYTQGVSVFMLTRLGFEPALAKRTVIESHTWSDMRASIDELQREIDDILNK